MYIFKDNNFGEVCVVIIITIIIIWYKYIPGPSESL